MKREPRTLADLGRVVNAAMLGDAEAAVWLLSRIDLVAALELMRRQARGRRCASVH